MLVNFLTTCHCPVLIHDLTVQLIWPLLGASKAFADHLCALGGLDVFIPLLSHKDLDVRCAGLAFAAHLLITKRKLLAAVVADRPYGLLHFLEPLTECPFDLRLYGMLRHLLLGEVCHA